MKKKYLFSLFIIASINNIVVVAAGVTNRVRSENDLFKIILNSDKYNKYILPQESTLDGPVDVKLGVSLIQLLEINTHQGFVHAVMWLKMIWHDPRLAFEASSNISVVRIRPSLIWKPNIQLFNNYEDNFKLEETNVLLYPDGKVLWVPRAKIKSSCVFDMQRFPQDDHSCYFRFEDAVYNSHEISLSFYNDQASINLEEYNQINSWKVLEAPAYNVVVTALGEPSRAFLSFFLNIKRTHSYYDTSFLLPSLFIALIIPLIYGFYLYEDKKSLFSSYFPILLTLLVLLSQRGNFISDNNLRDTNGVYFILFVIFIGIFCLSLDYFLMRAQSIESEPAVWMKNIFIDKLSRILMVEDEKRSRSNSYVAGGAVDGVEDEVARKKLHRLSKLDVIEENSIENEILKLDEDENLKNDLNKRSWRMILLVLKRIFFIFVAVISFLRCMVYFNF